MRDIRSEKAVFRRIALAVFRGYNTVIIKKEGNVIAMKYRDDRYYTNRRKYDKRFARYGLLRNCATEYYPYSSYNPEYKHTNTDK